MLFSPLFCQPFRAHLSRCLSLENASASSEKLQKKEEMEKWRLKRGGGEGEKVFGEMGVRYRERGRQRARARLGRVSGLPTSPRRQPEMCSRRFPSWPALAKSSPHATATRCMNLAKRPGLRFLLGGSIERGRGGGGGGGIIRDYVFFRVCSHLRFFAFRCLDRFASYNRALCWKSALAPQPWRSLSAVDRSSLRGDRSPS